MFSEINLPKLKACARAWAARNPLILKVALFQGVDFPYVLVIEAAPEKVIGRKNPVTGRFEQTPNPDYLRLQDDWAVPECLDIQDDLLEVSQNDFNCSARISTFFGKWQSHLLFTGEKPPRSLVRPGTETKLFWRKD